MRDLVIKRLGSAVAGLFGLSIVTFLLTRMIPGSVEDAILGPEATAAAREALREKLGLDKPVIAQYWIWLKGVLHGDFGNSYRTGSSVIDDLTTKLGPSIQLALLAMTFALVFAVVLGVIAAYRRGGPLDGATRGLGLLSISVPDFMVALLAVLLAARIGLPTYGYEPLSAGIGPWLQHLLLPAVALGLPLMGLLMRLTRPAVLEALHAPHVMVARSRGVSGRILLFRHVVRLALIPVITAAGIQFVAVVGGVVVVENVFSIPGVGRYILDSVTARDYPVVQGATIFIGIMAVVTSLIIDIAYRLLDPRVRT